MARRRWHNGRRRIHCARWEAPTGSPVRSWSSPASTIGRSLRMRSTPRCRGWPANWALPPCRRSRCRHRHGPYRSSRRSPSSAGTVSGMPDEPTPTPEPTPDPPAEPTATTEAAPSPPAEPTTTQPVGPVDTGYTASGVPTFESVREKIETSYGTAIGAAELDADTPEGRTVEEQYDTRQRAAAERLAQIRESMRKPEHESQ